MEVHINFSPIIYWDNWEKYYEELFQSLEGIDFKSECIFLTYNDIQYQRNSELVNDLCWKPELQEHKNSQYAPDNIRYKSDFKHGLIEKFKYLYSKYFDLETIRYIF